MDATWYKKAQDRIEGYPYYLAVRSEGRLKGQYPAGIQFVPDMKRKWDRGELGNGRQTIEIQDTDMQGLLEQLRVRRIDPRFDDVEFYVVRRPSGQRERIQYARLMDMARRR